MKSEPQSLFKLTLLYSVGNLSSKVMSFLLVFLTTFYLSKSDVGEFDLILTTIYLLTPFITFQIIEAVLRWLLEDKSEHNITKVFSTTTGILTMSLIFWGLIFALYSQISAFKLILPLYLLLISQSYYSLFLQTIRALGQNKMYAVNGVINTFLYVLVCIIFLSVFKFKVEGLLYGNIIALILSSSVLVIYGNLFKYLKVSAISKDMAQKLLTYSVPLIPNSLSWWVISSANRYLILLFLGTAANGVFAIAFKIPTILMMFISVFYMAWQEKAIESSRREDKDDYYSEIFEKYVRILFSLSILIVSVNKLLLVFLVSTDFFDAWKYTPVLMLGIILSSMAGFYGTGYLTEKKTKGAFVSSVAGGLITVVLSFILIPLWELYGAAASILFGYLALLLVRIYQTRLFFKIKFPLKRTLHYLLIYLIVTALNFGGTYFQMFNVIFAIITISFINKKDLLVLKNKYV